MRIAQVAPLFESVPPKRYGGSERVVHYLTEQLVKQGHEVTLFASGDSHTSAELIACTPKALRLNNGYTDATAYEITQLEAVYQQARRFDVIHFHTGHLHYPASSRLGFSHVTTQHGRFDIGELQQLYRVFKEIPIISISDYQRTPVPDANWRATVYHGLPTDLYQFVPEPQDYVAFLGRVSPEKRLDRAIEIATSIGIPLRVAAKVDKVDKYYHETIIKPLIEGNSLVEFIGEITDHEKQAFLGNARALLFPIDWPEPFGLAMIEAMACGTPVIAWNNGSVPEVIRDGVSGFIIDSIKGAIDAVHQIDRIDRAAVRAYFDERFTAPRMAQGYEQVYRSLMVERRANGGSTQSRSLIGV